VEWLSDMAAGLYLRVELRTGLAALVVFVGQTD
jgi:hypothetical protein